jgi:MATE family multidrug resistance protein
MAIHLTAFWLVSLPLGCVLGWAPDWALWRPAQPLQAQGFWIGLVVALSLAAAALTWLLRIITNSHVADWDPALASTTDTELAANHG